MPYNELVERIIVSFQKRLGYDKKTMKEIGLSAEEAKATVIRDGKKIVVIPRRNKEYIPDFVIQNADVFNDVLERYLEAIENTSIKSTHLDQRHTRDYFLLNIWKNATMYDFNNPAAFINRYTNFITDTTFTEYDKETQLGMFNECELTAQRKEDDYGFETPFIFQYTLSRGTKRYNFPIVRYGISFNRANEKVAYIYALQESFEDEDIEFRKDIMSSFNKVNKGVRRFRNVSPSAIITLSMFLGMLEKEGIKVVKAPDFLIGRYGNFTGATTEDEIDRIQYNLTNKFFRNFLRLSEHFPNFNIESFTNDSYNSFLCMSLDKKTICNNSILNEAYDLGKGMKTKEVKDEER